MEKWAQEILKYGKILYDKGFIVSSEGNLSCRIDSGKILATPSGVCKGELQIDDLVMIDLEGKPENPDKKPSSEIQMHLEVYRQRKDVKAVIHAHPPYALSLSLAGISLSEPYLPESVLMLGSVPVAGYARPSTAQVPQSISEYIQNTDILMLERHGSLALGASFKEAFVKTELLEQTAKIVWLSRQAGSIDSLPEEEVQAIMALREKTYGLKYPVLPFKKNR